MTWKSYLCGCIIGACLSTPIWAQQPAQYSMYMLNQYNYNTAYAGLDGSVSATGVFRKQWVSFPGSPLTFQANAHMPLQNIRSGIGIGFEQDIWGAQSNTNIRLSYNYIANLGNKMQLSIGGAARWMQQGIDGNKLRTPEGTYEGGTINHNDDIVPLGKVNGNTFAAEVGVYLKHDLFSVGLSAINLNQPMLSFAASNGVQQVQFKRAYFLTGSYNWQINDNLSLQPSFLLKTDLVKWQPELATILKYKDNFFGGVAFRGYSNPTMDAVVILAGMQITKNIMLAYSYDISVGSLRVYNSGSHEIVLNYNLRKQLGKEIPQKIIYNPRFL